jgi:hypothetical protein
VTESIRVTVNPERIELTPGLEPIPISVSVFNATKIVDEFTITLIGVGEWMTFQEERIRLFPDTGDARDLLVSIPRGTGVAAGERVVGVLVQSASDPSIQETLRVIVIVSVVTDGGSLTLEPQIVHGRSSGVMRATLRNPGNANMHVTFSGEDPEGAVRFSFSPPSLTVPPFDEAIASVTVAATPPKRGPERSRQLVVRAEGPTVAVAAAAAFIQEARPTRQRLLIARILLTVLGGGLLIVSASAQWANDLTGAKWNYNEYAKALYPSARLLHVSGGVLSLTSAGFIAIVLGVVGILGVLTSRGGLTLGIGILALLLLIAWAAAPKVLDAPLGTLQTGFFLAVAGSVMFVIAGIVGSRSG